MFSKALGNGHAVSALLGTDSVREGVERIQLTAAYMFSAVAHRVGIAMLEIYKRDGVFEHPEDGQTIGGRSGVCRSGRRPRGHHHERSCYDANIPIQPR